MANVSETFEIHDEKGYEHAVEVVEALWESKDPKERAILDILVDAIERYEMEGYEDEAN